MRRRLEKRLRAPMSERASDAFMKPYERSIDVSCGAIALSASAITASAIQAQFVSAR